MQTLLSLPHGAQVLYVKKLATYTDGQITHLYLRHNTWIELRSAQNNEGLLKIESQVRWEMIDALEIILIIAVVGGLLLLQIRTRTGSLFPYLAIVILLLIVLAAVRIIGSLVGLVIILVLFCGVLMWRVARSSQERR
jgi:uncharacterized iron-regulated membrane protein